MTEPAKSPFAIVPWEVFADERLGKVHLRVLGTILSFRGRNTSLWFATREQIAERCRVDVHRISRVTGDLERMGWLKKHGRGRVAVRYELTVPDLATVTNPVTVESQTVTEPVTVTKTVTVKPTNSDESTNCTTVTESATVTDSTPQRLPNRSPSDTHSDIQDQKQEQARASRLPNNWRPTAIELQWAARERPDVDAQAEADKFRDYWRAVPGAKGRKLDWPATWRNWIRNSRGDPHVNPARTTTAKPSGMQRTEAALREYVARAGT